MSLVLFFFFFFFKQKTAYEIGLGIPAEPLFRSRYGFRCCHLSLRRKRSSPNVFEMAATETITSIILIKLIRVSLGTVRHPRSEERRVGKEWRFRWSTDHEKKRVKRK